MIFKSFTFVKNFSYFCTRVTLGVFKIVQMTDEDDTNDTFLEDEHIRQTFNVSAVKINTIADADKFQTKNYKTRI